MRIIDRLEEQGLLRRVPDTHDRRKKSLFITKKGEELMDRIIPEVSARVEKIQSGIKPAELNTAREVLQKILAVLK